VHARVGASGAGRSGGQVAEATQRVLDYSLNGSAIGLSLPPGKVGPIVVQDELDRALRHTLKLSGQAGVSRNPWRLRRGWNCL
jgi:hypothetical protein